MVPNFSVNYIPRYVVLVEIQATIHKSIKGTECTAIFTLREDSSFEIHTLILQSRINQHQEILIFEK